MRCASMGWAKMMSPGLARTCTGWMTLSVGEPSAARCTSRGRFCLWAFSCMPCGPRSRSTRARVWWEVGNTVKLPASPLWWERQGREWLQHEEHTHYRASYAVVSFSITPSKRLKAHTVFSCMPSMCHRVLSSGCSPVSPRERSRGGRGAT